MEYQYNLNKQIEELQDFANQGFNCKICIGDFESVPLSYVKLNENTYIETCHLFI